MSLFLKNGSVLLIVNLGGGPFTVTVDKQMGFFNDNQWHRVSMNRTLTQVSILCNDISREPLQLYIFYKRIYRDIDIILVFFLYFRMLVPSLSSVNVLHCAAPGI